MPEQFLTQKDLARRWGISHRTLERWRWLGTGPRYLKVGARVTYRLADIRDYETTRIRQAGPTAVARAAAGTHAEDPCSSGSARS